MDFSNIWSGMDLNHYKQNTRCLAVNTILAGKYLVGPVLGQGGFGITYLGYDLNMETRIAIKEYFPVELVSRDTTTMHGDRVLSLSGEKSVTYQQGLKKYVAEAQNVSQFSETPGVVSVKDFFYENETAYIVMEYIDGISLKDYLKEKGGRLSEEESLAIMKPVLEALVKVHEAGIIHRDISPDNIMLTFETNAADTVSGGQMSGGASGGDKSAVRKIKSVKLIDFGAARMTAKNDQKSLTIILKHGYAPEEQYRTHGEQGAWTDVYAVCAVLYRMLTGETPVPAMDRMFRDDLKSFEELTVKVSGNTAAAILKGLAVKKDDRIQNMNELIGALYEGKTVKKSSVGNPKILIGAGIGVAAAVVFGIGLMFGLKAAKQPHGTVSSGNPAGEAAANSGILSGETTNSGSVADFGEMILDQTQNEAEEIIARDEILNNGYKNRMMNGSFMKMLVHEDGTVSGQGTDENAVDEVREWTGVCSVVSGTDFCMGLRADGTVVVVDRSEYDISNAEQWKDVISIAASSWHAVGLCLDGTVVSVGNNGSGQCEVASWSDMQAVAAQGNITVGVKKDGTVLLLGKEQAVLRGEKDEVTGEKKVGEGWTDIVQIELAANYVFGLKSDGTVLCINIGGQVYEEAAQECIAEITKWENIASISDLSNLQPILFGVDTEGKVHAYYGAGATSLMEPYVSEWDNIEDVEEFGYWRVLGRKKDGTYVSTPLSTYGNSSFEMSGITVAGSNDGALLALDEDGNILCYGIGSDGRLEYEVLEQWPRLTKISVSAYTDLHFSGIDEGGNCYFFCGEELIRSSDKKAVQVSEGVWHRAILFEDGTVEAWGYSDIINTIKETGKTEDGSCDVEDWKNVKSVVAAGNFTLGLTEEGTILAAGRYPEEILEWKDIVFLTADTEEGNTVATIY